MSIRVSEEARGPLLELLDEVERKSGLQPAAGLRAGITSGAIAIDQFVSLSDALSSLTGPIKSRAEELMARSVLFAPDADETAAAGSSHPLEYLDVFFMGRDFVNMVRLMGPDNPAVRSFAEVQLEHLDGQAETRLDLIYLAKLETDPITRDWPGPLYFLRRLLAMRPMLRLGDVAAGLAAGWRDWLDSDEEFFSIAAFLAKVVRVHRDDYMRYFALKLMMNLYASREMMLEDEHILGLLGPALSDREPLIAFTAWKFIYQRLSAELGRKIGGDSFSTEILTRYIESPDFGIRRYFAHPPLTLKAMDSVIKFIWEYLAKEKKEISIGEFTPYHSLADFYPNPDSRPPAMEDKYRILKRIVEFFGTADKDGTLATFFGTPSYGYGKEESVLVLELSGGERLLLQGHHRIAALIKAAAEGIIPASWLDKIPVTVLRYKGPMPEALIRRTLLPPNKLTWPDLFPRGTDLSRVSFERGGTALARRFVELAERIEGSEEYGLAFGIATSDETLEMSMDIYPAPYPYNFLKRTLEKMRAIAYAIENERADGEQLEFFGELEKFLSDDHRRWFGYQLIGAFSEGRTPVIREVLDLFKNRHADVPDIGQRMRESSYYERFARLAERNDATVDETALLILVKLMIMRVTLWTGLVPLEKYLSDLEKLSERNAYEAKLENVLNLIEDRELLRSVSSRINARDPDEPAQILIDAHTAAQNAAASDITGLTDDNEGGPGGASGGGANTGGVTITGLDESGETASCRARVLQRGGASVVLSGRMFAGMTFRPLTALAAAPMALRLR